MTIFVKLYDVYMFLLKWIISICLLHENKKVETYCQDINEMKKYIEHQDERTKNIQRRLSINHIELLNNHCRDKMKNIHQKIMDYNFEKTICNEEPINPYIMKFDNILTANECKQIITLFQNRNKVDIKFGKTGGGLNLNTKMLDEICLLEHTDDVQIIRVRNIILDKIRLVLDMYSIECEKTNHNSFIKNILRDKHINLPINVIRCKKYTKNYSYYRWHIDGRMSNGKDSFLSMIFYLNDLGNEGGTCFIDGKVYGKMGRVVVFPSCWYMNHRSLCCEDRDKYIINIIIDKTK